MRTRHQQHAQRAHTEALQARAAHVMQWSLEYIKNPEFDAPGAARSILTAMPQRESAVRKPRVPAGLAPYLASLYEIPLLTAEQEQYLFRKYNYLKHRVCTLRGRLNVLQPDARRLDEIEDLYHQAMAIKNQIIQANLRLVVSVAKKYVSDAEGLFDLISDGNMSLLKAVEKFDYALGFKFSTYATWAIKKNFARDYVTRIRNTDRFHTGREELLQSAADQRTDFHQQESAQRQRESGVARMLGCLSQRERQVVAQRYGLEGCPRSQTLKEIGETLGVSKERVRQLESRALGKLRRAAEELPGVSELFESASDDFSARERTSEGSLLAA